MSHMTPHPGLLKALGDGMTPKFLATRSAEGVPNVVPVTSIMPAGDMEDRLIFGNFLLRKSVGNLEADPRVGILVITTALEGWTLQGNFAGWQRTGPYVEAIMNTDLLRYNAYTGIRNAGIIEVRGVQRHFRLSKLRVLGDYLLARLVARPPALPADAVTMPPVVRQHFSPLSAVRVLAFLDDEGYPVVVPLLSLQPAGAQAMVCAQGLAAEALQGLAADTPVAASLLTFGAVSFQVHGRWLGSQRRLGAPVGALAVTAVYAGGPPIPGRQVA